MTQSCTIMHRAGAGIAKPIAAGRDGLASARKPGLPGV
jgi:hypothetical protein